MLGPICYVFSLRFARTFGSGVSNRMRAFGLEGHKAATLKQLLVQVDDLFSTLEMRGAVCSRSGGPLTSPECETSG